MTFSTDRRSTSREWSNPVSISTSGWVDSIGSSSSGVLSMISAILYIQIFHKFSVCLNEVLAQLHLSPHQLVEDSISLFGILYLDLHQNALLRIHSCLKKLLGVHLTKTLVSLLLYEA